MTFKRGYALRLLASTLSLFATVAFAETPAHTNSFPVAAISDEQAGHTRTWELYAEQWELARSGDTLLSLPVINHVITTWLKDKQKKIEIRYPGGEHGEFWVQELRDWLVALGIPSKNMLTSPGSGADDVIKFTIIK